MWDKKRRNDSFEQPYAHFRTVLLSYQFTFDNFHAILPCENRLQPRRIATTPAESHSCATLAHNPFRFTFLRKNPGGRGHYVNPVPKRNCRVFSFYRYFVTSLLLYFVPQVRRVVTSLLLYFALPSYTHSLSLQPRFHTC